jgi:tetratricopeptide (TPR) repeat protein
MMLRLAIFAVAVVLSAASYAQRDADAPRDTDALIRNGLELLHKGHSSADIGALVRARSLFAQAAEGPDAYLAHYYAALAANRAATLLMDEDADRADQFIDDAIERLERSAELNADFAEAPILLSSVYGTKIAVRPRMAMVLSPRAQRAVEDAERLDASNPRLALVRGISLYHTPEQWGGSKRDALEHLDRAICQFQEADGDPGLAPSWGYDEALAWKGMTLLALGRADDAVQAYGQALRVNPEYAWVREVLLPQARRKAGR